YQIPTSLAANELNIDAENQVIIYERGNLIFVHNFHPTRSIPDYQFFVPQAGTYELILNSDAPEFGGFERVEGGNAYITQKDEHGSSYLKVYCINRASLVLKKIA
ncbi:MAG: alpha amylase C-terminal domain-containing protein, partial [Bacteroidota bacterium]